MKITRFFCRYPLLILVSFFCLGCSRCPEDSVYEGLPFEMSPVRLPDIPQRSVSLVDFGGVGDGATLNTEAFAKAIETLSDKGGGRLVVPGGVWLTGPICLQSNIELHLEEQAVVTFSSDPDLYPVISTNFEGLDTRRCISPINAEGAHDIAITGEGVFDGNGQDWRELKRYKVPEKFWEAKIKTGTVHDNVWYPDEGYYKARLTCPNFNVPDPSLDEQEIKRFLRPVMVSLRNCEDVLLEGCTFQNSPAWNIHPLWCRNVTIDGITVRNPAFSTNGDGIDIDACENVILRRSSFDVGDDAICIKSGKDADGRRHARKCRNLIIDDCTVYHGHGGFVVGSEMSGGVENILVSRCRFMGTDVGLRFKSTRGRGGVVSNIWIDDIVMTDIPGDAVIFNLYYAGKSALEASEGSSEAEIKADETTPEFRDISIRNVTVSGAGRAVFLNGLPEMPLRNISFEDCRFTAGKGVESHYGENISFNNVSVNGKAI